MPNSGKTSTIERSLDAFSPPPFLLPEKHGYLKQRSDWGSLSAGTSWREEQFVEISKHILSTTERLLIAHKQKAGQFHGRAAIADRSSFDYRVFTRALFLAGRTPTINMRWVSSRSSETPQLDEGCLYATILCLVTPRTSLSRRGPSKKPGEGMTLQFLKVLYEQYLRFHYEMLESARKFPYACLDFSSSNPNYNQQLFNETLSQIFEYYKK